MGKMKDFFKRKSIKTAFTISMLACIFSALLLSLALSNFCQWGQSRYYKKYQIQFGVTRHKRTATAMDKSALCLRLIFAISNTRNCFLEECISTEFPLSFCFIDCSAQDSGNAPDSPGFGTRNLPPHCDEVPDETGNIPNERF